MTFQSVVSSFPQYLLSFFPVQKYQVVGNSMLPTFRPGDYVLVNQYAYVFALPQVGDVVAVKRAGRIILKRVQQIREQSFFVVGDNLLASTDSRHFGWITKSSLAGKVICTV